MIALQFAGIESIMTSIMDIVPRLRRYKTLVALALCSVMYALGLTMCTEVRVFTCVLGLHCESYVNCYPLLGIIIAGFLSTRISQAFVSLPQTDEFIFSKCFIHIFFICHVCVLRVTFSRESWKSIFITVIQYDRCQVYSNRCNR